MPETLTIELREPTGQQAPAPMPRPVPPQAGYQQPTIPGFPWLKMPVQPPQAGYQQPISQQPTVTTTQTQVAPQGAPKPTLSPTPAPFDPVALAREQVKRENERAQIAAEYAKLRPAPAFDPVAVAREQIKRERQQAQVAAAYNRMNPQAQPSAASQALEAAAASGVPVVAQFSSMVSRASMGLIGLAGGVALAVKSIRDLNAHATELAGRLSPYNPNLAVAQAQSDVRQVLGDIRRAALIGNELARFTTVSSKLSNQLQDLGVKLLKGPLEDLTAIKQGAANLVGKLNDVPQGVYDAAYNGFKDGFFQATFPTLSRVLTMLGLIAKNTGKVADKQDDKEKEEAEKAFGEIFDLKLPDANAMPVIPQGGIQIPVFRGV